MTSANKELPILEFRSADDLRAWLMENHTSSDGIWLRIYKARSGVESVAFEEVLDEGLCFGWSESKRRSGDAQSYLQRFTPRRTKGTTSQRNKEHAERLIHEGKMMPAGLKALGMEKSKESSALITEGYLAERAKRGSLAMFEAALTKVPDVEPEDDDKL